MKYPIIFGVMLIIIVGGFLVIGVRPAGAAKMVMFEGRFRKSGKS